MAHPEQHHRGDQQNGKARHRLRRIRGIGDLEDHRQNTARHEQRGQKRPVEPQLGTPLGREQDQRILVAARKQPLAQPAQRQQDKTPNGDVLDQKPAAQADHSGQDDRLAQTDQPEHRERDAPQRDHETPDPGAAPAQTAQEAAHPSRPDPPAQEQHEPHDGQRQRRGQVVAHRRLPHLVRPVAPRLGAQCHRRIAQLAHRIGPECGMQRAWPLAEQRVGPPLRKDLVDLADQAVGLLEGFLGRETGRAQLRQLRIERGPAGGDVGRFRFALGRRRAKRIDL